MLNKEQAFVVNEFIRKNATRNLWEVSDKLYTLLSELKRIENEEKAQEKNEMQIAAA